MEKIKENKWIKKKGVFMCVCRSQIDMSEQKSRAPDGTRGQVRILYYVFSLFLSSIFYIYIFYNLLYPLLLYTWKNDFNTSPSIAPPIGMDKPQKEKKQNQKNIHTLKFSYFALC